MPLRSLGLSKDPKDAQRQPSCFPDAEDSETRTTPLPTFRWGPRQGSLY
jgi:hypothetical protein